MIERYALVSGRIRKELENPERVVNRIEGAMAAARKHPKDQDFYLDSVALNLHDFYAGLERTFSYISSHVEQSVPLGEDWHRELLLQMNVEVPGVRPAVLSAESVEALDEYPRFLHVVRNVYTFNFDPERIERLVERIRTCFKHVRSDLLAFANFLEQVAVGH